MSKEIKMSDKFGSVPNFSVEEFIGDDSALAIPNVHMLYDAIDHAVNSHDTLTEQVEQLREVLENIVTADMMMHEGSNVHGAMSMMIGSIDMAKQLLEATK